MRRGAVAVTGRLLDVESRNRARDGGVEEVTQVSVVTEGGEVHAVDLGTGTVLRFADPALNQRVNRYLEMVASSRDQDRRSLTIDATGTGDAPFICQLHQRGTGLEDHVPHRPSGRGRGKAATAGVGGDRQHGR